MYFIYDLILVIILLLSIPVILFKMSKGKYREGLGQRFGFIPVNILKKLKKKKLIWVHAVSVGETVAASPIVNEIKKVYPDCSILFSTVTGTGQKMARKIIKKADAFIYFPIDFSCVVKRVINLVKPSLIIIMETELWPNFIRQANKKDIKIVYANGRISDKSAKNYKYLGPYLNDMLRRIDLFCMQSEQDVSYIVELGAEPKKVYNTGNTKLDQDYTSISPEVRYNYLQEFKIQNEDKVLVVGSTHANEEEQFIDVYKELGAQVENFLMILAPRDIKRIAEIEEIYNNAGINTIRRTDIENRVKEPVILLDTIGELGKIYFLADLVFIGGSLVKIGGHNILEPAAHGKLVFFGPYMFNFKESTRILLENKAAIQVKDKDELIEKMKTVLVDYTSFSEYGEKAKEIVLANKGASRRIITHINKLDFFSKAGGNSSSLLY